jgi:hypothetical protein
MGEQTLTRGPLVNAGSLLDNRDEQFDGPTINYQGDGFPDPRFGPIAKDSNTPNVPSWYNGGRVCFVDGIPSATNSNSIATSQIPSTTAGVAINLVTSVVGTAANVQVFSPGIPLVPVGTSVATTVSAIDFGFCTGTTTNNSSTVIVTDNSQFQVGQWLVIPGASSVTNRALITQVVSVSAATTNTIFISPVAGSTAPNVPIGQGNLYFNVLPSSPGASIGPANASAFAADPFINGGFAKFYDPRQMIARNVVVTSPTTASGTGTFLVRGYDVYGVPMSELIAATAGAGTAGKKAFKYISSITGVTAATSGTPASTSFGAGDLQGFHFAVDKGEYLSIFVGGTAVVNMTTGITSAFLGTTSSSTSPDVRGTVNMSTAVASTIGTGRWVMFYTPPMSDMVNANPVNAQTLFGLPQA